MKAKNSLMVFLMMILHCGTVLAADKGKPLTGDDLKLAQEMNKVYARHMMTTGCLQQQLAYGVPPDAKGEAFAKIAKERQTSCDCLSGKVIQSVGAKIAIDYATDMYGTKLPQKDNKTEGKEFDLPQEFVRVHQVILSPNARKECGFKDKK